MIPLTPHRMLLKKRKYRTKIRIISTFLLLATLSLLLASPFYWKETATSVTHPTKTPEKLKDNAMLHPHFQGIDSEGRPYSILAHHANHTSHDSIELHDIDGNIQLRPGKYLSLVAKEGILLLSSKNLSLLKGVDIFSDEGYEIHTESAFLNMKEGKAEGHEAVEIQHKGSILKAKGFSITDNGDKIDFTGPIALTYYPLKKN